MTVKAFDLVPAVERVSWTDKVKTVVECLESCGKNLYVGTQECFVIHYKYLEIKKPITLLKALSALNRILVLCDGNLIVLNMFDLEVIPSMTKLKGVSCFCLNENPETNNPLVWKYALLDENNCLYAM
ncbi:transforming growth factor-beta receptor-associated protein 1 homolog [Caerostris extrusa]|uniref:Transforming growth factor-beta receptor-associated protein 1 homolog n=1 Tax=Caerostris extrusa TaxID=172846 RepID=A0AAV4X9Y1_CAEEX|nr:transforming growth factor-beta receptor-associated protein 1 homolog [Caerostris extrusa]